MIQFQHYVGRVNGLRGTFGGLPPWARSIVSLFALPGLVLMALSGILFLVSILALLLLTVPVYSLLQRVIGGVAGAGGGVVAARPWMNPGIGAGVDPMAAIFSAVSPSGGAGAKHVESTVVESE